MSSAKSGDPSSSMPAWTDLPARARVAAEDAAAIYVDVGYIDEAYECAQLIYSEIRANTPPVVFPLFQPGGAQTARQPEQSQGAQGADSLRSSGRPESLSPSGVGGDSHGESGQMEPPLTCPAIDAFILRTNPPDEVKAELDLIRSINSQLRYSLWAEKARAQDAEKNRDLNQIWAEEAQDCLCSATEAEREACAKVADLHAATVRLILDGDDHTEAAQMTATDIAATIRNRVNLKPRAGG